MHGPGGMTVVVGLQGEETAGDWQARMRYRCGPGEGQDRPIGGGLGRRGMNS